MRENRDEIRQGSDQQQMLDDNQEIKARQRWHLLVKDGRNRLATAFAEPGGEHKGDAAQKRINRRKMQNVEVRDREQQLAVGVDIFP